MMVKKKVAKKKGGTAGKGDSGGKDKIDDGDINVSKNVKRNEENTLVWFIVIVGIVFAAVLVPYFWSESSKVFEFGGIDWVIEDYSEPVGEVFHGRFLSLTNPNLHYNVFFRTDPRTNDAKVSGKIDDFWSHEALSWGPEVEACRGDLARVVLDLKAFLKQGVGAASIESGFTDEEMANERGTKLLTCDDAVEKTVIILDIGDQGIVQDEVNPSCYTIYAKDCDDSGAVEKFIFQAVVDFNA